MALIERFKSSWNAFVGRDPTRMVVEHPGYSSFTRPDRMHFTRGNERSIVTSVYTRLAIDVSQIDIEHCRLDDNGRYKESMSSSLNRCLTLEANVDQTSRSFIQDVCQSMFDEGHVAIVPIDIDTKNNPMESDAYDILSLRTGRIIGWYPRHVLVNVYNDRKGVHQEIIMPKNRVAIVENPFYSIMNEPNSTMQRLIRKLNQLDVIDDQTSSGKLDMIIQLPYAVKTDARRAQAIDRKKDLEDQLTGSKYGIAYLDSTEKITQLNRAVENNIMEEVQYLTDMLYSQLGLTTAIMNGSATDQEMQNYNTRTIEPIISAIVEELNRKFISQTARTQKQSILFFRNPLKLVSTSQVAEIADKLTRNEIVSTNEMRQAVGFKPVQDEMADQLRNKNLSPGEGQQFATTDGREVTVMDDGSGEQTTNNDDPVEDLIKSLIGQKD